MQTRWSTCHQKRNNLNQSEHEYKYLCNNEKYKLYGFKINNEYDVKTGTLSETMRWW